MNVKGRNNRERTKTAEMSHADKIIDGKAIAKACLQDVQQEVEKLVEQGLQPHLSIVLVGDDPASHIYVRNKINVCKKIGIGYNLLKLASDISEEKLLAEIDKLNKDKNTHGILVQLPLPAQIDSRKLIAAINAAKDVDGFHPDNIAALYLNSPEDYFIPCTPLGCYRILQHIGFETKGANAVIVGRSNIVGKPLAAMLMSQGDASVSIIHSKTIEPQKLAREADLLVCAAGMANLVTEDWVKDGAVVLDVGINRSDSGGIVGDADFDSLLPRVQSITPVPGGIGPMTIAMLMANCVKAAKQQHNKN